MRVVRQGTRLTLELQAGGLDAATQIWPEVFELLRENLPVEVVLDLQALGHIEAGVFGRLRDVIAALCRYVPSVVLKGRAAIGRLLELPGAEGEAETVAESGVSMPPADALI